MEEEEEGELAFQEISFLNSVGRPCALTFYGPCIEETQGMRNAVVWSVDITSKVC